MTPLQKAYQDLVAVVNEYNCTLDIHDAMRHLGETIDRHSMPLSPSFWAVPSGTAGDPTEFKTTNES